MTKSLEALVSSVREKMKRPDELGGVMIGYFTLDALIAALEEKDKRTTACVNAFDGIETERIAGKSLGEFLAGELYLNKAEPKKDGSFGFTFSGFAIQMMAECFADQFKSSGAINYLELLFEHVDIGEMTVTMQRVEGLTPAGKLAAAESRIAELEALCVKPRIAPHQYRQCVNELTENARKYAGAGQLRERLSHVLGEYIEPDHPHTMACWGINK